MTNSRRRPPHGSTATTRGTSEPHGSRPGSRPDCSFCGSALVSGSWLVVKASRAIRRTWPNGRVAILGPLWPACSECAVLVRDGLWGPLAKRGATLRLASAPERMHTIIRSEFASLVLELSLLNVSLTPPPGRSAEAADGGTR